MYCYRCVVDVLLSTTPEEEVALRARGYKRLEPSLNLGNLGSPVHVWVLKVCMLMVMRGAAVVGMPRLHVLYPDE